MHILAPAVPILAFIVLWAVFDHLQSDWRTAFLCAAILWSLYLVAVTEFLSLLSGITFAAVLAAWTLALLLALGYAALSIRHPRAFLSRIRRPQLSPFGAVLLAACALIALVVALIAWVAPPNSYDSMTYHMPRVMHWIQNRSVAYYPTNMLAQIFLTPGGEYFILHFQLLAGSDRLAPLVAWFSMLACALGVSLIARHFGAGRRGQLLAVVVTMTLPMGILQASSTEDNWVTAFWLVCFVYWMLSLQARGDLFSTLAAGASLGLAALCKATTYVFALPFLVWFGLSILRTWRLKSLVHFGLISALFILVNLGTYLRSYELFGNPLGMSKEVSILQPEIDYKYSNDVFSLPQLASNVVRNTALQFNTPSESLNSSLAGLIRSLHGLLGISADDRRTTWGDIRFGLPRLEFNENWDGNALHLVLGGIGFLFVLLVPARRKELLLYALCIVSAFLIFCFYLKWQPYFSRLQVPLFVLFAPVLGKLGDQAPRKWIPNVLAVLVLLAALPWVFLNKSRPLLAEQNILNMSRDELYFQSRQPVFVKDYPLAAQFVADESKGQCSQVAVYLDHNDYEYPFWVLLSEKIGKPVSVESIDVDNISSRTSARFPAYSPCAVFFINNLRHGSFQLNGRLYEQAWTSDVVSVFLPR